MSFKGKYILMTENNGLDMLPVSMYFDFQFSKLSQFRVVMSSVAFIESKLLQGTSERNTKNRKKDSVVPLCGHSAAAFSKSGSACISFKDWNVWKGSAYISFIGRNSYKFSFEEVILLLFTNCKNSLAKLLSISSFDVLPECKGQNLQTLLTGVNIRSEQEGSQELTKENPMLIKGR